MQNKYKLPFPFSNLIFEQSIHGMMNGNPPLQQAA
jgi:hypothetical protein